MIFSSFTFLFLFLPALLTCYFLIPPRFANMRNIVLLLFSLAFYFCGQPKAIFLLLFIVLADYLLALCIDQSHSRTARRALLLLALAINFGMLVYFKYTGFFITNLNAIHKMSITIPKILLPVGISFYTFQGIGYVIDVYTERSKACRNPLKALLFLAMFPQLLAGPIVRYALIQDELESRIISMDDFSEGVRRFIGGLGKKLLLADTLSVVAGEIFALSSDAVTPVLAWTGAICYSFEIFYDFSGYSDMAIGLARMFGFHLPENFDYPYISRSITEFWRRWHITLGSWFRDYVYIPLGGNRKGMARQLLNILIVWALTGLWHGAAWNFVIWGLYFAILLMLEKLFVGKLLTRLPAVVGHIYSLFFIVIGWVIFSSGSLSQLRIYLSSMFSMSGVSASDLEYLVYVLRQYWPELIFAVLFMTPVFRSLSSWLGGKPVYRIFGVVCMLVVFALSLLALASNSFTSFIYFQF